MARPRKDGTKFSCLLDAQLSEQLHEFAQEHGMTITGVTELAIKKYIKEVTEKERNEEESDEKR